MECFRGFRNAIKIQIIAVVLIWLVVEMICLI